MSEIKTKTAYKRELQTLFRYLGTQKHEAKIVDKAFKLLFKVVSPRQVSPFIEKDSFTVSLDMLEVIKGKQMREDIEYWFYDCDLGHRDDALTGEIKGVEYTFNTLKRYIQFLVDSYEAD